MYHHSSGKTTRFNKMRYLIITNVHFNEKMCSIIIIHYNLITVFKFLLIRIKNVVG